jgi:hypothetical protein
LPLKLLRLLLRILSLFGLVGFLLFFGALLLGALLLGALLLGALLLGALLLGTLLLGALLLGALLLGTLLLRALLVRALLVRALLVVLLLLRPLLLRALLVGPLLLLPLLFSRLGLNGWLLDALRLRTRIWRSRRRGHNRVCLHDHRAGYGRRRRRRHLDLRILPRGLNVRDVHWLRACARVSRYAHHRARHRL